MEEEKNKVVPVVKKILKNKKQTSEVSQTRNLMKHFLSCLQRQPEEYDLDFGANDEELSNNGGDE